MSEPPTMSESNHGPYNVWVKPPAIFWYALSFAIVAVTCCLLFFTYRAQSMNLEIFNAKIGLSRAADDASASYEQLKADKAELSAAWKRLGVARDKIADQQSAVLAYAAATTRPAFAPHTGSPPLLLPSVSSIMSPTVSPVPRVRVDLPSMPEISATMPAGEHSKYRIDPDTQINKLRQIQQDVLDIKPR